MKAFLILIFCLFIHSLSYAQIVFENPKVGVQSHPAVAITKIELNNSATILSFKVNNQAGSKVGIADNSYIKAVGQPDTLFMTQKETPDTDSTGWYVVPEGGLIYRLFFPPINPEVAYIDFGEPVDNAWLIYDIELNRPVNQSVIPDNLLVNWFSVENGNWTFSFLDSQVSISRRRKETVVGHLKMMNKVKSFL